MSKRIVTHRLSLDLESQKLQATITLGYGDTATHRLVVDLRYGADVLELPPGSYAIAVQGDGADVLDSVTVYGADSAYPNCLVYDVSTAVTSRAGVHEARFLISCVDEVGAPQSLASPQIAFVVKEGILNSSNVVSSEPYSAVVLAREEVETFAENAAESAAAAAESASAAKASEESFTELLSDNDPEFIDNLREVLAAFAGMGEDKTVLNLLALKADLSALTALSKIVSQMHIGAGTGDWAEHAVVQNDGDDPGVDDGKSNWTNATHAAVFGNNNRIIATEQDDHNARNGFIGGGLLNKIYAENSFIGGGAENEIGNEEVNCDHSGIVAGASNYIDDDFSFIGGGQRNGIRGANYGFLGGGLQNNISGESSAIIGGTSNSVESKNSAILGGKSNMVEGANSVILGGGSNQLNATYSFIGGSGNWVKGVSMVVGGQHNKIHGSTGAVFGHNNKIGSFTTNASGNVVATGSVRKAIFAFGSGLQSNTNNQTLLGAYNDYDTGAVLIFGGGTSDTNRKNIYTLRASGIPEEDTDLVTKAFVESLILGGEW